MFEPKLFMSRKTTTGMNHKTVALLGVIVCGLLGTGCEKAPTGLFDPDYEEGTPPEIASVEPADSAKAGSIITIQGKNFASQPAANFVYFEATEGTVKEASPTELKVQVPDLVGDSVKVRIAVDQVEDFSNVVSYKLY